MSHPTTSRGPFGRVLPALAVLLAACSAPSAEADRRALPDTLLPVGGTRLFVHQEGEGDPVVIVHGGPVLDHGYLTGPLRPLADRYRLVYFDQRLSGRSEGVVDSASVRLDTLVADIERIRTGLGLERVHVLGHSWGGLLAAKYAIRHPGRVRSLVLVSPMPPTTELWREEQVAFGGGLDPGDTAGIGELRASEALRRGDPEAIERMLRLSFRGQLSDPALADSLHFHIEPDYGERSRQFGFMLPDLLSFDLTGELAGLRVPTLVVYGGSEPGAEIGGDTLAALLPRGRLEVIPGTGHFAFLERPERFLEIVRAFLEEPRAP